MDNVTLFNAGWQSTTNLKLVTPILRTIGNIAACTDGDVVQTLVDKDFIPLLMKCITRLYTARSVVKEIFWSLSNFAAGTAQQIRLTLASGAVHMACKVVVHDVEQLPGIDVLVRGYAPYFADQLPFTPNSAARKEALCV